MKKISFVLLLVLAPVCVNASNSVEGLIDSYDNKFGGTSDILYSSDIREVGARTIPEALSYIPGFIHFYPSGSLEQVVFRGGSDNYPRRMSFYLDGVKINNPATGGVEWEVFPVNINDVEKITVYKGAASTLNNRQSFNTSVFIETKSYYDLKSLEASANNKGGSDVYGRYTTDIGDDDFYVSFDSSYNKGIYKAKENSGTGRAFAKYRKRIDEETFLSGYMSLAESDNFDSESSSISEYNSSKKIYKNFLTGLVYDKEYLSGPMRLQASFINHINKHEQTINRNLSLSSLDVAGLVAATNPTLAFQIASNPSAFGLANGLSIPLSGVSDTTYEANKLELNFNKSFFVSDTAKAEISYNFVNIKEDPGYFDKGDKWSSITHELSANYKASLIPGKYFFEAGVTAAMDGEGRKFLSPGIILSGNISDNQSISLSASKGFRTPSHWEEFSKQTIHSVSANSGINLAGIDVDKSVNDYLGGVVYVSSGNDGGLSLEEVNSISLDYSAETPLNFLKARLYREEYNNLIALKFLPPEDGVGTNNGLAMKTVSNDSYIAQGFDMSYSVRPTKNWEASVAYSKAIIENGSNNIQDYRLSIPENVARAFVAYHHNEWRAKIGVTHVSEINWWPSDSDTRTSEERTEFDFLVEKCHLTKGCLSLSGKNMGSSETQFYTNQSLTPTYRLKYSNNF